MSRRKSSAREDRALTWSIVIAALAGVLACATFGVRISSRGSTAVSAREFAVADAEVTQLRTQVSEARTKARKAEALLAAARAIADHPDWSLLLNLLGNLRGDQVDLARVAIGYRKSEPNAAAKAGNKVPRGYWVRLSGQAVDQAAVAKFAVRLEDAGLFDKVSLTESKKASGADSILIDFQIDATIDEHPSGGTK
ncbi:MAG: PilN domain-containing protein [Phycisphaerales bacterium]|nr:PilN domain-containing protein [Phycisphaerales bacterium]